METAIEIQNVSKGFGARQAVSQLSLNIPKGSIFALLGDNGAGKTTTIKMLTGLLRPDSGVITTLGLNCWKQAVELRKQIGYVPERPRFYDWMTVNEIGWFTSGFHENGFFGRFQELMTDFGVPLEGRLRRLSKGEYAKVGLSLALAANPDVLILDEPTSGLDLLVRRELLTNLVSMASEGRTIVISSHLIAEVERVASHVAFLSRGKLLLSGTIDELRARLIRISLRCNGDASVQINTGTILESEQLGRQWSVTLLDPQQSLLEDLRARPDVEDMELSPLTLEEAYCALLTQKEGRS